MTRNTLGNIFLIISILQIFSSCTTPDNKSTPGLVDNTITADSEKVQDLAKRFQLLPSGLLDSVDLLCANSKSYQSNEWNELNHCRWALEKQVLAEIPEYAKRKDDVLSLQLDNGHWLALSHEREESENTQYFQLRKYIAAPHFFVVTQHHSSACTMQWLINAKNGQKLFFPGNIWKHPKRNLFITGSTQDICSKDVHLIHFNKAGDIKSERLDISDRLKAVKWEDQEALLRLENKAGSTEYRKWVLP